MLCRPYLARVRCDGNLQVVHSAEDQRVSSAVLELVPAVRSADGDRGEHGLDLIDSVQELLAVQVSAVQGLGADGDGLDDILISRDSALQCRSVLVKRLRVVRPTGIYP